MNIFIPLHRFPIAIKTPITVNGKEIKWFLEEVKNMVQIGEYHIHIVNLQGILYEVNVTDKQLTTVR